MAMNTPNWQKQYTGSTTSLATQTAESGVLIIDVTKKTAVIMDGAVAGGHPLAKEAVKIKSGSKNVTINDGTEANLSGDITIKVAPGVLPGTITLVENPAGQTAGKYLDVTYTKDDNSTGHYFVNVTDLVDTYLAGFGINITNNTVKVDVAAIAGSGLSVDATTGKLKVDFTDPAALDLASIIDTNSPLKVVNGKITIDLVSADAGNNLKAGTDGGVFFPADLGIL